MPFTFEHMKPRRKGRQGECICACMIVEEGELTWRFVKNNNNTNNNHSPTTIMIFVPDIMHYFDIQSVFL